MIKLKSLNVSKKQRETHRERERESSACCAQIGEYGPGRGRGSKHQKVNTQMSLHHKHLLKSNYISTETNYWFLNLLLYCLTASGSSQIFHQICKPRVIAKYITFSVIMHFNHFPDSQQLQSLLHHKESVCLHTKPEPNRPSGLLRLPRSHSPNKHRSLFTAFCSCVANLKRPEWRFGFGLVCKQTLWWSTLLSCFH